jgi:hypothetical protein
VNWTASLYKDIVNNIVSHLPQHLIQWDAMAWLYNSGPAQHQNLSTERLSALQCRPSAHFNVSVGPKLHRKSSGRKRNLDIPQAEAEG